MQYVVYLFFADVPLKCSFFSGPQKPLEQDPKLIFMHVLDIHKMFTLAKFEGIWSHGTCRKMSPNFILKLG